MATEYFQIGKLVASHGIKGELVLQHTLGKKTSLKDLPAILIEERKGEFLPWFISGRKIKSETEILLQIEGIDSKEAARKLLAKSVWLEEKDFNRYAAVSATSKLLGYHIIDSGKDLGPILELIEQPHQLLCRLEIESKEVLIPLHEESLRNVQHKKKQIIVELPDGLLDVYLEA